MNLPMRFASRVNCELPTRLESTETDLVGGVVEEGEPVVWLELEADFSALAGVVVDGDGEGHAVALGESDGQVEVDEEVLEDFKAGCAGAEGAVLGGGEHGHAPGGDGVGEGDGDAGYAVAVGDDFGVDVEGLGEVRADVRLGAGVRGRSLIKRTIDGHASGLRPWEPGRPSFSSPCRGRLRGLRSRCRRSRPPSRRGSGLP